MSKKKIFILSIIVGLIAIVTGVSVSYALWARVHVTNNNMVTSGCLNVEFKSISDDINLERRYPRNIIMTEGTYIFSITNTCTTVASYDINVDTLEGSDLNPKYLELRLEMYNLRDYEVNNLNDFYNIYYYGDGVVSSWDRKDNYLSDYESIDTTLENAIYSNNIYKGILGGRETHVFEVNTLIPYEVTDNEAQEKTWMSKIVVNSLSTASINFLNVDFDTDGFDNSLGYITVEEGKKYGKLPEPVREGYVLEYWYLDDDESKKVNENTIVDKKTNHTLKAKWVEGTLLKENAFNGIEDSIKNNTYRILNYSSNSSSLDSGSDYVPVTDEVLPLPLSFNVNDDLSGETSAELLTTSVSGAPSDDILNNAMVLSEEGFSKVYAWLSENILYYYSEAPNIYFNRLDGFGSSIFSRVGFNNLRYIDTKNLRTDRMVSMSNMFADCKYLETIDMSNFNTSNVRSISNMFANCRNLLEADLSSFDTTNMDSMGGLFFDCFYLESVNLSSFDTSNVTDMGDMFYDCRSLSNIDINNFNTGKVTNMDSMFMGCWSLRTLNVSSFNTSNVTTFRYIFADCERLTSLDLSNFDTSNIIYMIGMFHDCNSLESLDLSNFNTSKVVNMFTMFYNCSSLTSLNLKSFDTSNVIDMGAMFENCTSLETLDLSSFDTSKLERVNEFEHGMFENTPNLNTIIIDCEKACNLAHYISDYYNGIAISCVNSSNDYTSCAYDFHLDDEEN